ncbi:NAD(P)H-hydrate dehydratase [Candidatus Peregrinibacteria bacterium]|jgi:ADP-dependent NAD(P)H-hydrate dehydratase / NAD(P)H-hydrate epimerase|nr:NAD(P)H-hydrate dehydratase [Candidatus Peregrinibacteria bacterium]
MAQIPEIKGSSVKKLLRKRADSSHKGDNGRLLIVGGSAEYHGAPILAAKAALRAGADLVYLYVPACNYDVTRAASPDFIVQKFEGDYFGADAASAAIEFGKTCDAALVGPGFGRVDSGAGEAVEGAIEMLKKLHIPTVLDSSAIFALKRIKKFPLDQDVVITPHQNEFTNLVDRDMKIDEDDTQSIILLRSIAMDLHINVVLKGAVDLIASDEGDVVKNRTGNSGMTVGGTGDVLAGIVASLLAQGNPGFVAAQGAAYLTGEAGDMAYKKYGLGLMASDVADDVRG